MVKTFIVRAGGPCGTLLLLAYLSRFSPDLTAYYAIFMVYFQLNSAPLNPFSEHFYLRERVKGNHVSLLPALGVGGVLWLVSALMVWGLGHSFIFLLLVPVIILSHLLIKLAAAEFRAFRSNVIAVFLEFSLKPLVLLIVISSILFLLGGEYLGVALVISMIFLAFFGVVFFRVGRNLVSNDEGDKKSNVGNKPLVKYFFIGVLMVLTAQGELLALDFWGAAEDVAAYKVAMQLASVCGVITNLILIGRLKDMYAYPTNSADYRVLFCEIRRMTFLLCSLFFLFFLGVFFFFPFVWSEDIWWLAAFCAAAYALASSFGPLSVWFYAESLEQHVLISLLVAFLSKLALIVLLYTKGFIMPIGLVGVYVTGVFVQNIYLVIIRKRVEGGGC